MHACSTSSPLRPRTWWALRALPKAVRQIITLIEGRFDIFLRILGKVAHIFESLQLGGRFLRNEASRCWRFGGVLGRFCGNDASFFGLFLRNEATRLLLIAHNGLATRA